MALRTDREMLVAKIRLKKYKNENDVKDMIKVILDSFSHVKHFPFGASAYSGPGPADRLACFNGYFVGIEAKFDKRKLSSKQKTFLEEVSNAGGLAIAVNEKELLNLLECLEYVDGLPHAGNTAPPLPFVRVGISTTCGTVHTFGEDRVSRRRTNGSSTAQRDGDDTASTYWD